MTRNNKRKKVERTKLELQVIAEKILLKHNIDLSSHWYYLRLRIPSYDDLIIEKGDGQVLFGYYLPNPKGDLNPLVVFNYNNGYWVLEKIDLILGGINKNQLTDWQKKYAENITNQGWLENGVRVDYDKT